ncbi:hypothetical protein [uncultured Chryseobacterium sp.]|uniref:hypothetical protein n=1 Tax=uncultured Chryseobacterium sp. TaxID=259322 RepID=UPI0025F8262B|nr:hypothetical protein [uncultured Chryseobacterium sp.]
MKINIHLIQRLYLLKLIMKKFDKNRCKIKVAVLEYAKMQIKLADMSASRFPTANIALEKSADIFSKTHYHISFVMQFGNSSE